MGEALKTTSGFLAVTMPIESEARFVRVIEGKPRPAGMVLIPSGSFQMGDTFSEGEDQFTDSEVPLHSVYISAFYMDRYEVTKALWDEVYAWAIRRGYSFDYRGSWLRGVDYSKGANHPVHLLNWYDMVKWCNARSEKEGRVPAYGTSRSATSVYRTGWIDVQNDWVRWNDQLDDSVNWKAGYRLPTEAEWEKGARGGLTGNRFAWGDTIGHSQANYFSSWRRGGLGEAAKPIYRYDVSTREGYHAAYATGSEPFTSPVGSFAPNRYGIYDMIGNVAEQCWDWPFYYNRPSASYPNPRGFEEGSSRVVRGGSWHSDAYNCRVARRVTGHYPYKLYEYTGFRCVLPAGEP